MPSLDNCFGGLGHERGADAAALQAEHDVQIVEQCAAHRVVVEMVWLNPTHGRTTPHFRYETMALRDLSPELSS